MTRPLGPLISDAAEGRVVAFKNHADRFVDEWAELLDLAPLERRPYLCSGLVALGREQGEGVLELVEDREPGSTTGARTSATMIPATRCSTRTRTC